MEVFPDVTGTVVPGTGYDFANFQPSGNVETRPLPLTVTSLDPAPSH
jgi:hypothetical protein